MVFVIVLTYRAKSGEEDAIIALHEDWQQRQQPRISGFLSGDLLRDVEDTCTFVTIMRFKDQAAAQLIAKYPDHDRWYLRLVSLTEVGLARIDCTVEWHA